MKGRDCTRCQELLNEQWDGVILATADAELVRSHLSECGACTIFEREMSQMLQGAAALGELRYDRAVEMAPMILRPRSARAWLLGGAAGVAVALALALGWQWGSRSAGHVSPKGSDEVLVRVAVPIAGARSVALLGDFTGWHDPIPLARAEGGLWVGEIRLPAGRYRYVVVVDGKRMEPDPAAAQVVDDGFGGKNSVLDVGSSI
jgi:hypothetical protein